jgi:ankyrin repeat protein
VLTIGAAQNKWSALAIAARYGYYEILVALMEAGAVIETYNDVSFYLTRSSACMCAC